VQGQIERALQVVADSPVTVHCAGRTDTGVSATGQVFHFDTYAVRSERNWLLGGNANLPATIRLQWARDISGEFHARFSAQARRYRYLIHDAELPSALYRLGITHVRATLRHGAMHQAAQHLLGEQDFSTFRAASCQSRTAMRCVNAVAVYRTGQLVVIDIEANAFLHHMVRNIAGALIAVGRGELSIQAIAELLAGRDRRLAPPTAPAAGLYLVQVRYPAYPQVPQQDTVPVFLADGGGR